MSGSPRLAADAWQSASGGRSRRRALLGLVGSGGAGLLGWGLWRETGFVDVVGAWGASHATTVGETRELRLSDGSRVWLGSASAIDQDYGSALRRLVLRTGEVLVDTGSDPARPFVLDVPQGRLRALGTRFSVRRDGELTTLAVFDGAVELRTATSRETALVRAGEQRRFGADRIGATAPADPAREAWTRGLLLAADVELAQVVAELRRYRRGHLAVSPDVATLRVLGSFPLEDTDRALDMLSAVLPIRIRRPLPWWATIESGSPGARVSAGAD